MLQTSTGEHGAGLAPSAKTRQAAREEVLPLSKPFCQSRSRCKPHGFCPASPGCSPPTARLRPGSQWDKQRSRGSQAPHFPHPPETEPKVTGVCHLGLQWETHRDDSSKDGAGICVRCSDCRLQRVTSAGPGGCWRGAVRARSTSSWRGGRLGADVSVALQNHTARVSRFGLARVWLFRKIMKKKRQCWDRINKEINHFAVQCKPKPENKQLL